MIMSDNNAMELESLDSDLSSEIMSMSTTDLQDRTRLLDNEVSGFLVKLIILKYFLLDSYHEVRAGKIESRAPGSE